MQGEFEKMQRDANCVTEPEVSISQWFAQASPYSRSRETVIALAGTLRKMRIARITDKIK
jgi:galactose-1-phosphate uridylyltransferase